MNNLDRKETLIDLKSKIRQIAPVLRKVMMKDAKDEEREIEYWLSRSVKERAAAVTFIISQSLKNGERMDKTKLVKRFNHTKQP